MKSKSYLEFLSQFPCHITGSRSVELHHESVIRKFWGGEKKKFDFGAIPLSKELHTERHSIGRQAFWEKYSTDEPIHICMAYVSAYLIHGMGDDLELAGEALVMMNDHA